MGSGGFAGSHFCTFNPVQNPLFTAGGALDLLLPALHPALHHKPLVVFYDADGRPLTIRTGRSYIALVSSVTGQELTVLDSAGQNVLN